MVKVKDNIIGNQYGLLTVLYQTDDYISPNGRKSSQWVCKCACGNTHFITRGEHLKDGHSTSCGCQTSKKMSEAHKQYNQYDLSGEYGIGWTSNTNKPFYFDLDRYNEIKELCWFEHITSKNFSTLAAYNCKTKKYTQMHILLGYTGYDHIDHNELNNLKSNLRPATQSENAKNRKLSTNNTSGVTGVGWHKRKQMWQSRININGKRTTLGYYEDKNEAIKVRLQAELIYYGEFAPQKHLYEQYGIITTK